MSILAYHTTQPHLARLIARQGFRIPARASHSTTDAPGMGGTFFRTVFVTKKRPTASDNYGPALITVRVHGRIIPWQRRPDAGFTQDMVYAIRRAKRLGVAGVDSGRDDYGVWIVDPRAIEIVRVEPYKFA